MKKTLLTLLAVFGLLLVSCNSGSKSENEKNNDIEAGVDDNDDDNSGEESSGSSSAKPKSPRAAAKAIFKAMAKRDANAMLKLTTGYPDMDSEERGEVKKVYKEGFEIAGSKFKAFKKAKIVDVEQDGDEASVTFQIMDDGEEIEDDLPLVRDDDGVWRVEMPYNK